jgi:hypothetical protein
MDIENESQEVERDDDEQEQEIVDHESQVIEIEEDESEQKERDDDEDKEDESDDDEPAPRETRKERRERKIKERVETEVQERLERELSRRMAAQQQERRPEPKADPIAEITSKQRKILDRIATPGLPQDWYDELTGQYHELETERVRTIAEQAASKRAPQASTDEIKAEILRPILRQQYGELLNNKSFMVTAQKLAHEKYQVQRKPFSEAIVEAFAEAKGHWDTAQKARAKPSPAQAAKYASTRPEGASSGGGKLKVTVSKADKMKALTCYEHRRDWSDEKKVQEWVKAQRKLEREGKI